MTGGFTGVRVLQDEHHVGAAAEIVAARHGDLVDRAPFLPPRTAEDYHGKLTWLTEHGVVLGRWHQGRLTAFLGGVRIGDFRRAGPGCFSPDWANGAGEPASAFDDYRVLYREIAPRWNATGARIHALEVFASAATAIEALSLTGFGRIVMDAAAPTAEVAARAAAPPTTDDVGGETPAAKRPAGGHAAPERVAGENLAADHPLPDHPLAEGVAVRRATPDDAAALAAMESHLAEHIGASPVFLPNPRGADADWWRGWLAEPTSVAFLAQMRGAAVGYVKAEGPQDDVSDVVHDPSCLAINGMYCDPSARGRGVGRTLLAVLAGHAAATGRSLMSVDCETHNLEAYGFWARFFTPVTWSFERRV